jgi:hypothetical protein
METFRMTVGESLSRKMWWRGQREAAATDGMRVDQTLEGWIVVGAESVLAGPFATQAEAWRWLDRVPTKGYGR